MTEHHNVVSRRAFVAAAGAAALTPAVLGGPTRALAEPASAQKQAEADAALAALDGLKKQFEVAESNYAQAVVEQQEAKGKMDEAQSRIDEASARISDLQDQLSERARTMYRNGSFSFLDLLLGATTFQAFTTNWDLLNTMNQEDADRVSETKDLKAEVQTQRDTYEEQERVAREKAQDAEAATRDAEAAIAEQQSVYNSLSAEAAALVKQEQEAAAAAEAANARNVVQQSIASAGNGGGGGTTGGGGGGATSSGGGSTGGGVGGSTSSGSSSSSSSGSAVEEDYYEDDSSSSGGGYSSPSYDAGYGNAIVARAYAELGKPYVWAACGPDGYDCSGLVSYCLTGVHERVGTTYTFMEWPTVSNPQPGDVCVRSEHTGIYIGDGQMIHASTWGVGVIIGPVQSSMKIVRPPW